MARGIVKWFNDDKGYGFITPDDGGKDLFEIGVHPALTIRRATGASTEAIPSSSTSASSRTIVSPFAPANRQRLGSPTAELRGVPLREREWRLREG